MTDGSDGTPWRAEPVIEWLFHKGRKLPGSERMLDALCRQVVAAGLPLDRVGVFLTTLHPLYFGFRLGWTPEAGIEVARATHQQRHSLEVTTSPVLAVMKGDRLIRRRLDAAEAELDYSILAELKAEGFTDYLVVPLEFGNGARNALTLATRRPGGFSGHDLAELEKLLHVFTLLLENDVNQTIARTILDTYIGPATGRRVLEGQIARGDGSRLDAVIWCSDLRESTRLSEELPDEAFLDLLNDYFEVTAGAWLAQGGEVLKFIGDAALGVIPVADGDGEGMSPAAACARALAAAREALARAAEVNAARTAAGKTAFRFGVGLHRGAVMYGNIGVPTRLDFTVTGSAINHAVRVEGLCKPLGRTVVATEAVARHQPEAWAALGSRILRGAAQPVAVFGLARDEAK